MDSSWTRPTRLVVIILSAAIVIVVALIVAWSFKKKDDQAATASGTTVVEATSTTSSVTPVPKMAVTSAQTSVVVTTTSALPPPPPPVPKPVSDLSLPKLNTASLKGADQQKLFNRVRVLEPQSWGWASKDEIDPEISFVDMSGCSDPEAGCPHVRFGNLASPAGIKKYGSDPVAQWKASSPCREFGTKEKVKGPAMFTVGGVQGHFYQQQCAPAVAASLWIFPDKKLLVIGEPGTSPEITQAVLSKAEWL